jgi:photosystem I P700 chlorophyll a apoprotein A1
MCHLVWLNLALGLHSEGLYLHNDSLQALGRPQDMFGDNAIQLKPVLATGLGRALAGFSGPAHIEVLDGKLTGGIYGIGPMGTADFMVFHIHAFTIHLSLLILLKASLYARSSRLVADKVELGFRYPCDGPGRGGTCQISPFDHVFLGLFWAYNSVAVMIFHFFWKLQSDVWGSWAPIAAASGGQGSGQEQGPLGNGLVAGAYPSWAEAGASSGYGLVHLSGGDFSVASPTINAWLRNFLWTQAAQVIQSYGSSTCAYGLIFLGAHFLWAFSLMFLFSGRGYWQELIESLLWAHLKLKLVTHIQPRALSISQGRAVGLFHFAPGGVGCSWAFFISRTPALA